MKYVVLARDEYGIINSFSVFSKKSNAKRRLIELLDEFPKCVVEIDPNGDFEDDECEDE